MSKTKQRKGVNSDRMDTCAASFVESWSPPFKEVVTEGAYHEYLKRAYRAGYTTGHADAQDDHVLG